MIIQLIGKNVKARTEAALYLAKKLDAFCISDTDIPMAANHDQWSRWLRSLSTIIVNQKNIPVVINATFPSKSSREQFRDSHNKTIVPDISIFIDIDGKDKIPFEQEWEDLSEDEYNFKINSLESFNEIDLIINNITRER